MERIAIPKRYAKDQTDCEGHCRGKLVASSHKLSESHAGIKNRAINDNGGSFLCIVEDLGEAKFREIHLLLDGSMDEIAALFGHVF